MKVTVYYTEGSQKTVELIMSPNDSNNNSKCFVITEKDNSTTYINQSSPEVTEVNIHPELKDSNP